MNWARTAWAVWLVVSLNHTEAQESYHVMTPKPVRPVPTDLFEPPAPAPGISPHDMRKVRIAFGPGGSIEAHRRLYNEYQNTRTEVAVTGGCYSACTLVVAHINPERLCFGEGAFLAFHAAWTTWDVATAQRHQYATNMMYMTYPPKVREWIDRQGGPDKLPGPGQGYWVMYNHEIWAMGYARCP
jgi:hypothetical protein